MADLLAASGLTGEKSPTGCFFVAKIAFESAALSDSTIRTMDRLVSIADASVNPEVSNFAAHKIQQSLVGPVDTLILLSKSPTKVAKSALYS